MRASTSQERSPSPKTSILEESVEPELSRAQGGKEAPQRRHKQKACTYVPIGL